MREATADLDGGLCELRHYDRRGITDYGLYVELVKLWVIWIWVGWWLTSGSLK